MARNRDNVFECTDMSTHELLLQCASTIKKAMLFWYTMDITIISSKCNLFLSELLTLRVRVASSFRFSVLSPLLYLSSFSVLWPVWSVSLDCSLLMTPSVFSSDYWKIQMYIYEKYFVNTLRKLTIILIILAYIKIKYNTISISNQSADSVNRTTSVV